jgi:arginyl-tRNA synthetase
MKAELKTRLAQALSAAQEAGELPLVQAPEIILERPRQTEYGDLASNLAMQLAKPCRMNPRAVAQTLLARLGDADRLITKAEVAGPGFLNFFVAPVAWMGVLTRALAQGPDFGRGTWGRGRKAILEFVSANPTGPLHVGHGRGAAVGDVLARLLRFSGFTVTSEYYINDAGNQMATLGRSVLHRARELRGATDPFPENHYRGEYIKDLAAEFLTSLENADLLKNPPAEAIATASAGAGAKILKGIEDDLRSFGVELDSWFSERSLLAADAVTAAFADLNARGLLYENEGALWFKATAFGDEKDRVVRRSNGELTYFASDIAYHLNKLRRGFDLLVDVWGADHHGYVPRLKAALAGLGRDPDDLTVVLVQMVNLLRGGAPVAMSTRAGEFVTLKEILDEVGSDSARFLFLTRRTEAQLDFDLEMAKAKSMDNPVFYVQYAHTRVKSMLKKAQAKSVDLPAPAAVDLTRLTLPEETGLALQLAEYPEIIESAARNLEPHRLTYYLHDLAGAFHSYYNAHRVLAEDRTLATARLVLIQAVGAVLAGGLGLLGVSAPEAM